MFWVFDLNWSHRPHGFDCVNGYERRIQNGDSVFDSLEPFTLRVESKQSQQLRDKLSLKALNRSSHKAKQPLIGSSSLRTKDGISRSRSHLECNASFPGRNPNDLVGIWHNCHACHCCCFVCACSVGCCCSPPSALLLSPLRLFRWFCCPRLLFVLCLPLLAPARSCWRFIAFVVIFIGLLHFHRSWWLLLVGCKWIALLLHFFLSLSWNNQ